MRHSIEMEKLTLGVCYYPEHWDRALWKDDLQRMKQYGIGYRQVEMKNGLLSFHGHLWSQKKENMIFHSGMNFWRLLPKKI